ncbi:DUF397 domain-containing protein [Saccharopolyspora gloriosae]|uniref:DUF397 domain-containing protein n=1 Tax=Saccharopolyspora gloriosae TaxID=455344 RepID=UPI001FB5BD12|nr:DUF397 domain-containing protein [Saccharopolyspora gloriosae]
MTREARDTCLPSRTWFKSSYSGPNNNSCVEARMTGVGVDIRDSKDPEGALLSFDSGAWRDFLLRLNH